MSKATPVNTVSRVGREAEASAQGQSRERPCESLGGETQPPPNAAQFPAGWLEPPV